MVAAKVTYEVEQVAPDEARAELTRLWDENLTIEGGVDRKFEWLYREAPDWPEAVFLLAATSGDQRRRVGTAGVGVRRIALGELELRAGLLADLAVDREHRTVMPALSLVRAVKAWALGGAGQLDLAYGFPNHLAEGVFKRVGYRPLGTIGRWARVLRHASYASRIKGAELPRVPPVVRRVVERAADVKAIAAVAGGAVDVARLMQIAPSAVAAARRFRLTWLDAADARIDEVWAAARREHEVVGVRNARFLRWRFPASPQLAIALASARGDGAPLAYAVIEHVEGTAHVRDLFGTRDAVTSLLDLLVPALYPRGSASVSIRYLGAPWLGAALEQRGWVPRASERVITVGLREGLAPEVAEALTRADRWHITDADEDT